MKNRRILAYFSMVMIAGVLCGFILSGVYHDINQDKKPALEISSKAKTVTPNTPIVYEKEYTKCGHTVMSSFENSQDLVGKELVCIQRKYSPAQGYSISWQGDTLVIKQQIDEFCPQDKGSYRLKNTRAWLLFIEVWKRKKYWNGLLLFVWARYLLLFSKILEQVNMNSGIKTL